MRTLIVSLGLGMIPAFAQGTHGSGGGNGSLKVAGVFVGVVLAAMLRALIFGDRKTK